jgi:hypothetical protein
MISDHTLSNLRSSLSYNYASTPIHSVSPSNNFCPSRQTHRAPPNHFVFGFSTRPLPGNPTSPSEDRRGTMPSRPYSPHAMLLHTVPEPGIGFSSERAVGRLLPENATTAGAPLGASSVVGADSFTVRPHEVAFVENWGGVP